MVNVNAAGFLARAALLGTTALTLFGAPFSIPLFGIPEAAARVGVTSATDGDPLGKPPTEAERVLRIGIDVQANELITTNAKDRAHLVFLDGTSLTVGPNAQLTIDRFVFDPATKTGDLAITASKGLFRLVGGKISKTKPITIATPSATIGIRGGITIFNVQPASTTSTFIFGNGMTFTAGGQTQTVTRPGSQVTASGGRAAGAPTLVSQGGLSAALSQLEGGGQSSGQSGGPSIGTGSGSGAGGGNADQKVQSSGFSSTNSGQSPGALQPTTNNPAPQSAAQRINNSNVVNTALSNAETVRQDQQGLADARNVQEQQTQTPSSPTVIVSHGRLFKEQPYLQSSFNNQTLTVTPNPQNDVLLQPTGAVANGQATFSLADGRSVTLPWQAGAAFPVVLNDPTFGPLYGFGIVSANTSYFAYFLTDSSNKRLGIVGGTPTTLAQFPTSGFAQHVLFNLGNPGFLPFSNDTVGGNSSLLGSAVTSPLYSTYSSNISPVVGGPIPGPQTANALQATISIAGQGATQKSYMGVFIGQYFRDTSTDSIALSGRFNAAYRLGASQQIGRQTSAESTFDTGGGNSIFGPNTDAMVLTPDRVLRTVTDNGSVVTAMTTTRTPQASFDQAYTGLVGTDYYAITAALKIDAPPAIQSRTTQTMNGYVGGLAESLDGNGNFSTRQIGSAAPQPTGVIVNTDAANNRASATFNIDGWDTGASASFRLGGTTGASYATSSFIDDRTYAVADRPSDVLTSTTSVTVGTNTSSGADVQSRTVAVSSGVAPLASFFSASGITPCTCEFLTWGVWGGDLRYNAGSVYNPGGRDRLNFASYVAGTLTTVTDLSTLNQMGATATYSGHMFGNVQKGATNYVAAGSYTNSWSFGSQTGKAAMSFDGATYGSNITANTVLNGGGPTFSTPTALPSTTGPAGRNLTLNGSFVSAPGAPAKGQIGNFAISGPSYKAGGTFAAQKP